MAAHTLATIQSVRTLSPAKIWSSDVQHAFRADLEALGAHGFATGLGAALPGAILTAVCDIVQVRLRDSFLGREWHLPILVQ